MNFSTQIVMISGIQISSPVMKYFFTAPETKRPGSRRAGWLVGVYSVSGAGRLLRLGFGLGFRFCFRFGFRFGLGFGLGRLLFRGFLEVRCVPAGAFQLEAGRAEQLLEGRFAAGRALAERRLRSFLQELFLVATLLAAVFVDRHGQNPWTAIISLILGGKAGNQEARYRDFHSAHDQDRAVGMLGHLLRYRTQQQAGEFRAAA